MVALVREVHRARLRRDAGRDQLVCALRAIERLLAWLHAAQAELARRLASCAAFPQADLADATRTSLRDADRVLDRAGVLEQAPVFADALDDAKVTAGHVDALGRTLRSLEPAQREGLLDRAEELAEVAQQATVEEFARRLRTEARRLAADDGLARLERQRRDTRLRTWVDQASGMWCLNGRFDPESGLKLAGRLDNAVASLFADATPDTCPSDTGEKQDHLRAWALVSLTEGTGRSAGSGRPEVIAVVDATDPDPSSGRPSIDWGLPVELPTSVLLDLWGVADVHTVVVRNGVVVHAPGNLTLGRSTRVASRAQRRALRALYKTCAIPGCAVRYQYCKLHHVIWWEDDGLTDVDNLLPVCERHHHAIHDHGWRVQLGPRRELTVDLPDGTRYRTGPPQRGREQVTRTTGPSGWAGPGPPRTGSPRGEPPGDPPGRRPLPGAAA